MWTKKADPLALRVERRALRREPGFGRRAARVALVDLRLADRAAVNQRLTPVAGLARQHQVGSGGAALRRFMPHKDMLKRDLFGAVLQSRARRRHLGLVIPVLIPIIAVVRLKTYVTHTVPMIFFAPELDTNT